MNRTDQFSILFLALLLSCFSVLSQTIEKRKDTLSLRLDGEWRNYLMLTENAGKLQDWNAWATGGKLGAKAQLPQGFSAELFAYLSIRVFGNDQTTIDSITGSNSRYEPTLFDVTDKSKDVTAFIGQMNVQYVRSHHSIRLGRQSMESPFINPQDGRMIPSLMEGVRYTFSNDKWKLGVDYIWAISPRGTGQFYKVEDTFGVLSQGKSITGMSAQYKGNVASRGIINVHASLRATETVKFQVWNYFVENVFNTLYVDADKTIALRHEKSLTLSGQYIWQSKLNSGGNEDATKTYFDQNNSHIFGLKAELRTKGNWMYGLSTNWISPAGRMLFPREWGREGLYTFIPRERSEGCGATQSLGLSVEKSSKIWDSKLAWSRNWRSAPEEALYNKYGIPAYDHIFISLKRKLQGSWSRTSVECIAVYKYDFKKQGLTPQFTINRVNMWHINLIVNYRLGG